MRTSLLVLAVSLTANLCLRIAIGAHNAPSAVDTIPQPSDHPMEQTTVILSKVMELLKGKDPDIPELALTGLAHDFRAKDVDGQNPGTLEPSAFGGVLVEHVPALSLADAQLAGKVFARGAEGRVNYIAFLNSIFKKPISKQRMEMVSQAFRTLLKRAGTSSAMTAKQLVGMFRGEQRILGDIRSNLGDAQHGQDPLQRLVRESDFKRYYQWVSPTYASDDKFQAMLTESWELDKVSPPRARSPTASSPTAGSRAAAKGSAGGSALRGSSVSSTSGSPAPDPSSGSSSPVKALSPSGSPFFRRTTTVETVEGPQGNKRNPFSPRFA